MTTWTKTGPNDMCCDASDLRENDHCPRCGAAGKFVQHRDKENEITHWTRDCRCGAQLTIFND